jgi:geranylgeranyl pyrophosphate synthase
MVSDVDATTLDALTEFGRHLGLCFQIVDDVLDVTGSDDTLGKQAGKDLLEGVYTLPVIYALGGSDSLRALIGRPLDADALRQARELVAADGAVSAALDAARGEAKQADEALSAAEALDVAVCGSLRALVDGLVTRSS